MFSACNLVSSLPCLGCWAAPNGLHTMQFITVLIIIYNYNEYVVYSTVLNSLGQRIVHPRQVRLRLLLHPIAMCIIVSLLLLLRLLHPIVSLLRLLLLRLLLLLLRLLLLRLLLLLLLRPVIVSLLLLLLRRLLHPIGSLLLLLRLLLHPIVSLLLHLRHSRRRLLNWSRTWGWYRRG